MPIEEDAEFLEEDGELEAFWAGWPSDVAAEMGNWAGCPRSLEAALAYVDFAQGILSACEACSVTYEEYDFNSPGLSGTDIAVFVDDIHALRTQLRARVLEVLRKRGGSPAKSHFTNGT